MHISFERRYESSVGFNLMLPLAAVIASLVLCSGLILLGGANPLSAYTIIAKTAFGGRFAITETLAKAAPMILTGLAAAIAFRARFWNIGGEGQLLLGAMAAAYVGALATLPAFSLIPLMIVLGAAGGALGAMLPAFLKARFKVDDVVSTLMLNFIILYVMLALLSGPWKDTATGWPDSPDILRAAEFPNLLRGTRLHLGVLIAGIASLGAWFLVRRTTLGFSIDAVGENPRAAHHAGHNVARVTMITAAISGAMAGLAGVGEVAGIQFQVMGSISPGYGYAGLVVAMLARLNPLGVVPAAIFLAAITAGADEMSRQTGVPVFLADVIQGVTLIAMLIALMFSTHRLRLGLSRKQTA
ncbi:MAG: ABC transporter permease [Hyphomicrobiaceae bacterium]